MELWLIRHGQTVANASGVIQGQTEHPLDAIGISQAEHLANRLRTTAFDHVISSDLGRALDTARILSPEREVELCRELREWDLGCWTGRSIEELRQNEPESWARFLDITDEEFRPASGESRKELRQRAATLLQEFAVKYAGKRLLAVTHGGFIRAVFANLFGCANKVHVDNTGITVFHYNGAWQLARWNDIAHLEQAELHNSSGSLAV